MESEQRWTQGLREEVTWGDVWGLGEGGGVESHGGGGQGLDGGENLGSKGKGVWEPVWEVEEGGVKSCDFGAMSQVPGEGRNGLCDGEGRRWGCLWGWGD